MRFTEDNVRASVDRYYASRDLLSESRGREVEFARGQGLAYVWGWQDGRPNDRADSYLADAFSWAWGTVAALFEGETITSKPALQDAWQSFLAHGEIRDYNGRALDTITPKQLRAAVTE